MGYAWPQPRDGEIRFDIIVTRPDDEPTGNRLAGAFTVPVDGDIETDARFQFAAKVAAMADAIRSGE